MARGPRTTTRPAAGGPPPAVSRVEPAARVLTIALAVFVALRAAAAMVPGRALWGHDLARDLAPASLALGTIATVAAFGFGAAWARRAPRGAGALAILGALTLVAFLWTHPDRALVTGDTSLRHSAFATTDHPERFAEQAMRGDLVLHHALPRAVAEATGLALETVYRLQGVLAVVLMMLAAWALARALAVRGAAAVAVLALPIATGALALFNGYGKATVEVCVLTLVVGVGMARTLTGGGGAAGGALLAGLAVALSLLLHRSAIALLPAWAITVALAWNSRTSWTTRQRMLATLGTIAPVLALFVVAPRLAQVVTGFDASHHLGGDAATALWGALSGARTADALNALGLLFPAAPLSLVALALAPRPSGRSVLAWGAFALPPLALLWLTVPQHGLPRDWDVYAFAGVALAVVTAAAVARVFAHHPRAAAAALPLAVVALVPALQWAALQADAERAWMRTESVLVGPPARPAFERARGFDTIGMLCMGRGLHERARHMFERAAEAAPNPSTFVRIGMTETLLGRPAEAMTHYRRAATLDPRLPTAWRGLAAAASATGDRAAMVEAVTRLAGLVPDDPTLADARAWLAADSVRRATR